MRFAFGQRAGMARALCGVALFGLAAGTAAAQGAFKGGEWNTADGGAVSVKPDWSFEAGFTDAETNEAVFTTGKCQPPKANGADQELTCKPLGKPQTYIIVVHADGSGELDVVDKGARHKATTLSK